MYLNLLYKSLKEDTSLTRTKSFIKRIIQVCTFHKVPFICGALYLISEILKLKPGLFVMLTQPEHKDDDEEEFKDVELSDDEKEEEKKEGEEKEKEDSTPKNEETKINQSKPKYDGKKRDPKFANSEDTCFWELTQFATHFHPTVALYSQKLLQGKCIEFPNSINYDPLQNHTLSRFLDRFIYKNPKKLSNTHKGGSIMQPKRFIGSDSLVSSMKKQNAILEEEDSNMGNKKRIMLDDPAVNTQNFLQKNEKDIPVDEVNKKKINKILL